MKHIVTKKKIFGMIHLSGSNPVERALKEIEIFVELYRTYNKYEY